MELTNKELQSYIEDHTSAEPLLLQKLNRETNAKVLMPRMLSGHLQGRILSMISYMVRPEYVLEIGTYTGYSAICLAGGLAPGGKLFTIDINEELEDMARRYFTEAGIKSSIDYRIGDARNIIPEIREMFDIVFIDADKASYGYYFDLVIDKVKKNGFIIADNVLWSGKVLPGENKKADHDTEAIIDFNDRMHRDNRVENVILPVRDGLMLLRKV